MNLTSVTSLQELFCGYDLVFNSVAEVEKCTELMSRIHHSKWKGQASGSAHLPAPEQWREARSRNQLCQQRPVLVSAGASLIAFSRTRAGSPWHPLARLLSWCGVLHVQGNSSAFQPCSWGQYPTVKPQQQEHFPNSFLSIVCPWISKMHIELDWIPGQFKEGTTSSISSSTWSSSFSSLLSGSLRSSFQLFLWQPVN